MPLPTCVKLLFFGGNIAIFWGQLRRARMHESNARTRISELPAIANAKTKMYAAKLRRGNERLNANLVF
jgi:hypothetical protein